MPFWAALVSRRCTAEDETYQDHLGDEGVLDAGAGEHRCPVVEEVLHMSAIVPLRKLEAAYIRASQLLEHLQSHANRKTVRHLRRPPHPNPLLDRIRLDAVLGGEFQSHLLEFHLDAVVVLWHAVHIRHRLGGLVDLAMSKVEAGSLGKEQHAST